MLATEPIRMIGNVQTHLVLRGVGPAVVMIHGSQAWSYAWRFQIQALADAGYQAIAVDLPGNGYSATDANFDYSINGMSNFLKTLLDHLQIPSAVFIASSAGGLPVLNLAIQQSDRVAGLVLVSACGIPHRLPLLWRMARIPVLGECMGWFLREEVVRWNLIEAVTDASCITPQDVHAYYLPLSRPGAWKANLKIERSWDPAFVEANLARIHCPTLIVWGENDPWHPLTMAHEFARQISISRLEVLSRCGHLPQEERPEAFNQLILDFQLEATGRFQSP